MLELPFSRENEEVPYVEKGWDQGGPVAVDGTLTSI